MKSKDDKESKDNDDSEGIVVEDNINELKLIKSNTNTIAENNTNKIKEASNKKYEEIDTRNKIIMRNTIALLECNSMRNLSELAIIAISAIDNIERGSLKEHKKVKSFLGRWYEKIKIKKIEEKYHSKDDNKDKVGNDLFVKRDRIITCNFEIGIFNDKTKEKEKKKVDMKYRVLSVYTKQYNKWFMTLDKQP